MRRALLWCAAAALMLAGCGESSGPTAGDLVVSVNVATPARAVLLRIVGPAAVVSAPSGSALRVLSATVGDTTRAAVIAPAGATLGPGALVRLAVPDTRVASQYSVVAEQASGSSNQLVTFGGSLSVGRQ